MHVLSSPVVALAMHVLSSLCPVVASCRRSPVVALLSSLGRRQPVFPIEIFSPRMISAV